MMHCQLLGLQESLGRLLHDGVAESTSANTLVAKLTADTLALTNGKCIESLDIPTQHMPVHELVVLAANMLAISHAFLSPEEAEAAEELGFHTLMSGDSGTS